MLLTLLLNLKCLWGKRMNVFQIERLLADIAKDKTMPLETKVNKLEDVCGSLVQLMKDMTASIVQLGDLHNQTAEFIDGMFSNEESDIVNLE